MYDMTDNELNRILLWFMSKRTHNTLLIFASTFKYMVLGFRTWGARPSRKYSTPTIRNGYWFNHAFNCVVATTSKAPINWNLTLVNWCRCWGQIQCFPKSGTIYLYHQPGSDEVAALYAGFGIWNQFSSVQSLSHVQLFVNPWTAARRASLSITNTQSLLKLTSIEIHTFKC